MKRFLIFVFTFAMIFNLTACLDSSANPSIKSNSSYYEGKNYEEVEEEFKDAGFTNIKYEIIYDLIIGFLVSDGEVEYVTIDGSKEFKDISEYFKTEEVVIAYHTYEYNKPQTPNNPEIPVEMNPSQDIYDDTYEGDKYRVNFVIDFDSNLFFDIYDVDFRVDGRKFKTLKHGEKSNFELDLKPGEHYISFTNEEDINVYGQIVLNVSSDMVVNYWIKGHEEDIELKENEIILNAYCTITLDCNGGSKINPFKEKKGYNLINTLNYLTPLGMDDYYFLGWYLGEDKIGSGYLVNENITVTAKWKKKTDFVYDYAFIRDLTEYDLYYLFDTDTNRYVFFGTNDTYVEYGSYIGNLDSGAKVRLNADNGSTDGYNVYFKINSYAGTYYDHLGADWSFSRCVNSWEIELEYDELLNNKNGIGIKSFTFELINNNTEYEISGYVGTATEIVIPSEYNGKPVTSIGDRAFINRESLTKISLSNNITNIGSYTFFGCTKLKSVDFGVNSKLKVIGDYAFVYCESLTDIVFSAGLNSIGVESFNSCYSLENIIIPESVTSIGNNAFYDCSSLTIKCEAKENSVKWSTYWNSSNCPVIWGYKG